MRSFNLLPSPSFLCRVSEKNIVYDFLLELYLDRVFKEYGSRRDGEPVDRKLVQDRFNNFCRRNGLETKDNVSNCNQLRCNKIYLVNR